RVPHPDRSPRRPFRRHASRGADGLSTATPRVLYLLPARRPLLQCLPRKPCGPLARVGDQALRKTAQTPLVTLSPWHPFGKQIAGAEFVSIRGRAPDFWQVRLGSERTTSKKTTSIDASIRAAEDAARMFHFTSHARLSS